MPCAMCHVPCAMYNFYGDYCLIIIIIIIIVSLIILLKIHGACENLLTMNIRTDVLFLCGKNGGGSSFLVIHLKLNSHYFNENTLTYLLCKKSE